MVLGFHYVMPVPDVRRITNWGASKSPPQPLESLYLWENYKKRR